MERGSHRLNALLIAVAASLGVLIGVVGATRREPTRVAPRDWTIDELATPASAELAPVQALQPFATSTGQEEAPAPAAQESAEPRSRVLGYVFLPEGGPATGARVRLGGQEGRADADGRFELRVPPAEGPLDLVAFRTGNEPALLPAFVSGSSRGAVHEVRLVLGPPSLTLAGRVLDEQGHPLKNWTVELDGHDALAQLGLRERVRTDAEGAYLLTDVPTGVHVVRAWKDRREAAFRSEPAQAGSTGLVVTARDAE